MNMKIIIAIFSTLMALTIAQPLCTGFQYAPEGAKCDPIKFPEIINTTIACEPFLKCSAETGLCTKPVSHGTTCTNNDDCIDITGLGIVYQCIQNKCTYKRHFGQACSHNDECYSGVCEADKCVAKSQGESCTEQKECKVDAVENIYLYCSANNTCQPMSSEGGECDLISQNCLPGLHCVTEKEEPELGILGVNGTCQKYAGLNEDCSPDAKDKPSCISGLECMFDTNKCETLQSRTANKPCQRGDHCIPQHACSIQEGQETGFCAIEGGVKCNTTVGEKKCKSTGYCRCTSPDTEGACASDLKDVNYCPTEKSAYLSCVDTKCNYVGRGSAAPFPADNCAASQCANEFKAYVCCARESAVLPADFLTLDCTPPQSSPEPTTSGAAGIIVSTIVVIAAAFVALM